MSLQIRKRIEQGVGWIKIMGGLKVVRGVRPRLAEWHG
jgi:hypothetical protein